MIFLYHIIALIYIAFCKPLFTTFFYRLLGAKHFRYRLSLAWSYFNPLGAALFLVRGYGFDDFSRKFALIEKDFNKKYKFILALLGGLFFYALSAFLFFSLQFFIKSGGAHDLFYALFSASALSFALNLLPLPNLEIFTALRRLFPKNRTLRALNDGGKIFLYTLALCSFATLFFKNGSYYDALSIIVRAIKDFIFIPLELLYKIGNK
ncbi:MAG: hypothetical protein LBT20_08520 [Clostridiales bacterium]|jgi:hypothetical protein|nr:hypothetical protein [Clostridiales bacterium]